MALGLSAQEVIARFEEHLAAIDEVEQAEALRAKAVARERELDAETHRIFVAMERFLRSRGENDHEVLAEFGLVPHKRPGPKTALAKKTMAEKARATRAARGTLGKKQRRKMKGRRG